MVKSRHIAKIIYFSILPFEKNRYIYSMFGNQFFHIY